MANHISSRLMTASLLCIVTIEALGDMVNLMLNMDSDGEYDIQWLTKRGHKGSMFKNAQ